MPPCTKPDQAKPLDFSQFNKLIQTPDSVSPPSKEVFPDNFTPAIALVLGQCCTLADKQYWDNYAKLGGLNNFPKSPPTSQNPLPVPPGFDELKPLGCTPVGDIWSFYQLYGSHATDPLGLVPVYPPVGFIVQLTYKQKTIIVVAFRGTETPEEIKADLDSVINPAATPFRPSNGASSPGSVCKQFYDLYTGKLGAAGDTIQTQIRNYFINNLRSPVDVYVTGHSLGGTWAVFSALDIAITDFHDISSVSMYSMESPRVAAETWPKGEDQVPAVQFVSKYQSNVPNSYRIVNAADSIPLNPPNKPSDNNNDGVVYAHVTDGQDENVIMYCAYSKDSDAGKNHSCYYLPYLYWLANSTA